MSTFWFRVRGAGILLALLLVAYLYIGSLRQDSVDQIRRDLNELGRTLCERGKESNAVGKYNGVVEALIRDYKQRRDENIERREFVKARIDSETIGALKNGLLPQEKPDCSRPLLPERG